MGYNYNIFFSQMKALSFKIDFRYQNSFTTDPDITISVRLANILLYTVSY
jgi:hypothetical protein